MKIKKKRFIFFSLFPQKALENSASGGSSVAFWMIPTRTYKVWKDLPWTKSYSFFQAPFPTHPSLSLSTLSLALNYFLPPTADSCHGQLM